MMGATRVLLAGFSRLEYPEAIHPKVLKVLGAAKRDGPIKARHVKAAIGIDRDMWLHEVLVVMGVRMTGLSAKWFDAGRRS